MTSPPYPRPEPGGAPHQRYDRDPSSAETPTTEFPTVSQPEPHWSPQAGYGFDQREPQQPAPAQPQYGYPAPPQYVPQGQQPPMYSAGAGAPARPQKSKALGAIGLGIVLVTGVIMCALCWVIGDAMATFLVESGVDLRAAQDTGDLISDARVMEFADGLGIQTAIVQGCAILGFAGWIVSIVAAITGRGRAMGVIGLIVGIFVPIVAFGVGIMGLLPALEGIGA